MAHFGDAGFFGDLSNVALNRPIVGIAQPVTTAATGWPPPTAASSLRRRALLRLAGGTPLNKPIVGMAPTLDGAGYWLVATDGGSLPTATPSSSAPWGAAQQAHRRDGAEPDGGGYWMVASDGGIFAYGDAPFYGSTGSAPQQAHRGDGAQPTAAATSGGLRRGHLLLRRRSVPGLHREHPPGPADRRHGAVPDGGGYWFSAADGGLLNYGTAPFLGAAASQGIGSVVGMASDGTPTLPAFVDAPATRSHATGPVPLFRPVPANIRRFAGP